MAYDSSKPANDSFLADFPPEMREQLRAIIQDAIVNAGLLNGLKSGNASGNIPISNGVVNTNLNADKLDGNDATAFATSGHVHAVATGSSNGFMANTDKTKLDGIYAGAEVNQNAFSNVLVNGTTVQADSKTDTLELVAGTNITLTPNATNDRVTIANSYVHPTGDGNLHVPTTGTTNNTKVLKAGATVGSAAWSAVNASEVVNAPAGNITSTTVQAAINELDTEKVNTSDVVTVATANKILKLDANGKLPASITGASASCTGLAATATKLDAARTLALIGAVAGSVSTDFSSDISITVSDNGIGSVYDAGHSFADNGWQKLSNGLILQWGSLYHTGNWGWQNVVFPISFKTGCKVFATLDCTSDASIMSYPSSIKNPSLTNFNLAVYANANYRINWFAIGY